MKEKFEATIVSLEVADKQVLFILLSKDGAINRQGDGSADCKDHNLHIGRTDKNLFDQLMEAASPELVDVLGDRLEAHDRKGRTCKLNILFKGEGIDTGVEFIYGERSQGPPQFVADYVIEAVELTEPWFQKMKKMIKNEGDGSTGERKKWWEFWK
jgi:hypothetical protein